MFQPTLGRGPARVLFFALRETVKNLQKADLRNSPERRARLEYHHKKRTQDEICRAAIARLGTKKAAELGRLFTELLKIYVAEHGPYEKAGTWLTHGKHAEETRRQTTKRVAGRGMRDEKADR
jgi:hypothetical protein